MAVGAQLGQDRPLGQPCDLGGRVANGIQQPAQLLSACQRLDRQYALPRRRNDIRDVQRANTTGIVLGQAQALKPGHRNDDRVQALAGVPARREQPSQPSLNVAPQGQDLQVVSNSQKLRLASQAARADPRLGGQVLKVQAFQAEKRIPRVFPRPGGGDYEIIGQGDGHVLGGMNGELDVAFLQCRFQLGCEKPLAAERPERTGQPVAFGHDGNQFDVQVGIVREDAISHNARLCHRQSAAAGTDSNSTQ